MNQVDLLIIAVVGVCALSGARRGLISSAGDIISLALGMILGSIAYPLAVGPVRWLIGTQEAMTSALAFVLVSAATVALASWGFSALADRFDLEKRMSRAAGAGFGAVLGVFFAAILVMASAFLPGAQAAVERSPLAGAIVRIIPRLHENLESVGLPLPKLVQLPTDYRDELSGMNQGRQFLRINFTRLDGAMCIHCRTATNFEGYQFVRGTLMSPRYRCPNCGRTSDGCQTFEGFHEIYGECPAKLAGEGLQFDCGVWTNGWWTTPNGPCPICGREFSAPDAPNLMTGALVR